ncbi:hypothetical protein MCOR01_004158 [Pyricularia oryzae]|nr:hypothetical protein MCOR01_004158 [Pyricularia oryzae]
MASMIAPNRFVRLLRISHPVSSLAHLPTRLGTPQLPASSGRTSVVAGCKHHGDRLLISPQVADNQAPTQPAHAAEVSSPDS